MKCTLRHRDSIITTRSPDGRASELDPTILLPMRVFARLRRSRVAVHA